MYSIFEFVYAAVPSFDETVDLLLGADTWYILSSLKLGVILHTRIHKCLKKTYCEVKILAKFNVLCNLFNFPYFCYLTKLANSSNAIHFVYSYSNFLINHYQMYMVQKKKKTRINVFNSTPYHDNPKIRRLIIYWSKMGHNFFISSVKCLLFREKIKIENK